MKRKPCKTKKHQKRKKGGSSTMAYTNKGLNLSNPGTLAYTGRSNGSHLKGGNPFFKGVNAGNSSKMYPSPGPPSGGFGFLNPLSAQFGGHGHGSSYPNGLVGSPYNNPNNLPGVNGTQGGANYYENNVKPTLQTMTLKSAGANPPFLKGGRGSSSLKGGKRKQPPYKGGATFSNTLGQEFINLGRSVPFAFNSAYNGLFGYPPPINPSPMAGQFGRSLPRM